MPNPYDEFNIDDFLNSSSLGFRMQGVEDPMQPNPDAPIQGATLPPVATPNRAPAVVTPPAPAIASDVTATPSPTEYIKKKFNLGEYSDENRKKLNDEANQGAGFGTKLAAAAAALGAGLMGGNAAGAGQGILSADAKEREGKLDKFEKGRAAKIQDYGLDRQFDKDSRDDDKISRENDLNSDETRLARTLAQKMAPGVDFSKMNASQINDKIPTLKTIYEIEAKKLEEYNKAQDRKAMLGMKANEGQKALDKDYAKDYNDFTGGGEGKAVDAIQKLKDFEKQMSEDDGLFQAGGGPISGSLPDAFRTQASISQRDNIVSTANSALKATFGGQLSDGERKALANEFYNDKLSNAENLKIIRRKIAELENGLGAQRAKAKHFQNTSSLSGFKAAPQNGGGGGGGGETKVINGKTYVKVPGGWEEQ